PLGRRRRPTPPSPIRWAGGPDPAGTGGREGEPPAGVGDSRFGQRGEGPAAEPLQEREPGVDRTRDGDGQRAMAGHRRVAGEHRLRRGGGRGTPGAVVAVEGRAVPDNGEAV